MRLRARFAALLGFDQQAGEDVVEREPALLFSALMVPPIPRRPWGCSVGGSCADVLGLLGVVEEDVSED